MLKKPSLWGALAVVVGLGLAVPHPSEARADAASSHAVFSHAVFSHAVFSYAVFSHAGSGAWVTVQPGTYRGRAFDACAAPSSVSMAAWRRASPYRAIGIYFGGVDRRCAQPNLTAAWVRTQVRAGWHLIPLYVGPQAACTTATDRRVLVNRPSAWAMGAAAAQDAVKRARALGIARGSTLIYDMEAYATGNASCSAGVVSFMGAWTAKLHRLGYYSGFYSSMASGVANMVAHYRTPGYPRPDFLDFARWDSVARTSHRQIPAGYWPGHRRMKQYEGRHAETYGSVTITIDRCYVDYAPVPKRRGHGSKQ